MHAAVYRRTDRLASPSCDNAAQVQNEHVWSTGWMDVIINGMKPEEAADKALRRVAEIFEKYPIPQS